MKKDELTMLQALPLEVKVMKSKQRIKEFIGEVGRENCYISYSGGKDSSVLAHLVREVEKEYYGNNIIPLVYCNTGVEYPDIVKLCEKQENILFIKPKHSFVDVIKKYGYPVVSKETSSKIYKFRHHNLTAEFRRSLLEPVEKGRMGMIPRKWQYLLDCDFEISSTCCEVLKKRPFHAFEKASGKTSLLTGEMASESRMRSINYLTFGCNNFERKGGAKSTPLGFWLEQDILRYIKENNIELAKVYGEVIEEDGAYRTTGVQRTGCMYCLYGASRKDDRRFDDLKLNYPQIYDYCMRGGEYNDGMWQPRGGLGYTHVLEILGGE